MNEAQENTLADNQPGKTGVLSRVDDWLEYASDWVNPILIKETRQALKSQQFVVWFMMLLAGCWVVTIGGLAVIGPSAYYAASGGQMYQWYAWMLAFPLLVVVPFSAFRSLAAEQEDNTRDVLTVSALSPRQVVNGKLGSAALQMLIYLSAIAPCLGFTYLLRGVDVLTLFLLPALGALASLALSLVGLLLASLSALRYVQVLLSVALIGGLLLLFWGSIFLVEDFVTRGYSYYQSYEFWMNLAMQLTAAATTSLLVYFAAVACNTFTSANRSTPLRIAMLVQQAAFIGWVAALWRLDGDFELPAVGCLIAMAYWTVVGMVLTGEKPVLSERVRRSLPSSFLARVFFTWLTPGPGTGYVFAVANLSFCLLLAVLAMGYSNTGGPPNVGRVFSILFLLACYAIGYLGLGRLLILLLRKVAEVTMLGGFLIHFLTMLAGSSFPFVLRSTWRSFRSEGFSYVDLTSPFAMFAQVERNGLFGVEMATVLILVGGVAGSLLLANLALAALEIRQTRLPLPQRVIEDDLLSKPMEQAKPTNPWGDLPGDRDARLPTTAPEAGAG